MAANPVRGSNLLHRLLKRLRRACCFRIAETPHDDVLRWSTAENRAQALIAQPADLPDLPAWRVRKTKWNCHAMTLKRSI
jgi:hypothetical protein